MSVRKDISDEVTVSLLDEYRQRKSALFSALEALGERYAEDADLLKYTISHDHGGSSLTSALMQLAAKIRWELSGNHPVRGKTQPKATGARAVALRRARDAIGLFLVVGR